jgi:hypothetical protein
MLDFNAKADEFLERIRVAPIVGATDVYLIYHVVDALGVPLSPVRVTLSSLLKVKGGPGQAARQGFALTALKADLLNQIDSLVRNCPSTPFAMPETGGKTVTVVDFDLEIVQP